MKFFKRQQKTPENAIENENVAPVTEESPTHHQHELTAVIALAIHKYVSEVREYENTVLTIQQVIKPYSPWSSKIYGLRQQPMHIPALRTRVK